MTTQRRGRSIAMTDVELDTFLASARSARVATVDSAGRPHVTPLWFVWHAGELWLNSLTRSSRWAHVTRRPDVAAVIDDGDRYEELRGVELRGRIRVVGEVPRGRTPHAELDAVEELFAAKYRPGRPFEPDGRHAWLALTPLDVVSWDFRKIRPPAS